MIGRYRCDAIKRKSISGELERASFTRIHFSLTFGIRRSPFKAQKEEEEEEEGGSHGGTETRELAGDY